MIRPGFRTIQSGLVIFWALWLSLIVLTNTFDALKHLGVLPESWTLASYNYALIRETITARGVPAGLTPVLFAGVIAWELLAAALFFRAWSALRRGAGGRAAEVTEAFAVSLALWCAFLLATEAFVAYAVAATHKSLLIAQIATLLLVRSEPDA